MSYWVAFAIGAFLGSVAHRWRLIKRPIYGGYPIQGFVASAVLGGLVYGTIVWLIAKAF